MFPCLRRYISKVLLRIPFTKTFVRLIQDRNTITNTIQHIPRKAVLLARVTRENMVAMKYGFGINTMSFNEILTNRHRKYILQCLVSHI